jgi:hypothetical protein
MRYSHKIFDPHPSSSVSTNGLANARLYSSGTATQRFSRKANLTVFAQNGKLAETEQSALLRGCYSDAKGLSDYRRVPRWE